jgi:hypothetical protein
MAVEVQIEFASYAWYDATMTQKSVLLFMVLVMLGTSLDGRARAATAEFTIDPERSLATLSGMATGLSVVEQGAGSLTTSFQGNLRVELEGQTIQFPGGSLIDARFNGDWSPKSFGEPGTEPADFGAAASGGFLSGTAAVRDVLLDLESASAILLSEGEFAADGLVFVFPEETPSAFDYRITALGLTQSDRRLLSGYATNLVAALGTLQMEGNTQTMIIPVQATILFELLAPGDSTLTIEGQLVASRMVSHILQITSTRLDQGELRLEWDAHPETMFTVEQTTDLVEWIPVANVPGDVARWQTPADGEAAYFRVVIP